MGNTAVIDYAPGAGYTVVIQDDDVTIDSLNLASSDATLEVQSGNTLATSNGYRQAQGTLTGAGTVDVSDRLVWSGGTMAGSGVTRASGGFEIPGGVRLDARRFVLLGGTGVFNASNTTQFLTGANGAVLEIQSGATFEDTDFSDMDVATPSDPPTLINRGTIQKTGGARTDIGWRLRNEGTVEVLTTDGALRLNGQLISSSGTVGVGDGTFRAVDSPLQFRPPSNLLLSGTSIVEGDTTLQFGSSASSNTSIRIEGELDARNELKVGGNDSTSVLVTSVSTLTELGAEEVRVVQRGQLAVNTGEAGTPDSVSVGRLRVGFESRFEPAVAVGVQGEARLDPSPSTIRTDTSITVAGTFEWTGGTVSGGGTIRAEGGFVWNGGFGSASNGKTLDGVRVVLPNGQTGTYPGAYMNAKNEAVLEIGGSALFEMQNDSDLGVGAGSTATAATVVNRGTFRKTTDDFGSSVNWAFQNTGTVETSGSDGNLDLRGTPIGSGGTAGVADGVYRANGGNLRFFPDSSVTFPGTSVVEGDSTVEFQSGVSADTPIQIEGELDARSKLKVGGGDSTSVTVASGAKLTELGADALRVVDRGQLIVNTGEAGTPDSVSVGRLRVGFDSRFEPTVAVGVQGEARLDPSPSTIRTDTSITVAGTFEWTGGTVSGGGTIRAEGGFVWNGGFGSASNGKTLDGVRVVLPNGQTGTYPGAYMNAKNEAVLEIGSSALFEMQNDSDLGVGAGSTATAATVVNRGIFKKTADFGSSINWVFQNDGTVATNLSTTGSSHYLRIADSLTGTGGKYRSQKGRLEIRPPSDTLQLGSDARVDVESGGTIEANLSVVGSATFEVGGQLYAEFPIFAEGGTVTLTGSGELLRGTPGSLVADTALVLRSGTLQGTGAVTGDLFANGGVVRPGGDGTAGTMTVSGLYKQSGGARLNAELGGTTGGTDYDSLSVNEATLAGELRLEQLNDFNPTTSDTLRPVVWSCGVRNGPFDQISGRSTFDSPLKVQYDDAGDNALEVAGKILPGRDVSPTSLSDTLVFSKTQTQSLTIENTETDSDAENLEAMIQAQDNPSWLSLSTTSVSIPPGGTATVDVQLSAQRTVPGTYRDTIEVTDPELDGALPVPVQFTIERPNITLSPSPQVASPGSKVDVEVTIPKTITPKSGSLAYRPAGDQAFQFASLDANVSGLTDNTPHTVTTSVPASAVTKRGVQYYVRLTSQDSTGTVPINTPAGVPSRSAFVPVEFQEVQAEGSFPEEGYRMLTVPVAGLGDRSVFDLLKAQYGAYDPAQWRFARWAPSQSAYREGADVGPLQPGEAAWFVLEEGTPFTITGGGRSIEASSPRPIPLKPGWNQVGNPFPFSVAWSSVEVPTPVRPPVGYDPTRSAGERFRFGIDVLPAWSGAFVYNSADTSVTLTVPPEGANTASSAMKGRALTHTKSSDSGYRLRAIAHVSNGGRQQRSRPVQLGFAAGAENGLGTKDRVQPPAVRSQVRLQAAPSEGPALARSVKPVPATDESAAKQGGVWDLTLHLGKDGQTAETAALQLSAAGSRPDPFRRYVVDRDENRRLPMTHETATVPLSEGRSTRRLRVIVGTKAFAKAHSDGAKMAVSKTTLHANAPNPFSESTTIPYQVAEETHVRIAVYDLLGRRVSVLVNGTREAGVHEFQWQPGVGGASLASGTYFCRMTAGGETFTQKLVVVR